MSQDKQRARKDRTYDINRKKCMLRILSRKNYRYAQYNINLGQSLAEEDVQKKGKQLEMQREKSIIECSTFYEIRVHFCVHFCVQNATN